MRWLRRRRDRRRQAGAAAPFTPVRRASWADPAFPPAASPASLPASLPAPGGGVRLGFADGTEVELSASHPNAVALRAFADLLVQDERRPADN